MKKSLKTIFLLKKNKTNKKGKAPIYMRLNYNGVRSEFSTDLKVPAGVWDQEKERVLGKNEEAKFINTRLHSIEFDVQKQFNILESLGLPFTVKDIANKVTGKGERKYSVLEVFQFHNDDMKQKIGINNTESSYKRYLVTYGKVKDFIRYKYHKPDLLLEELNHSFVTSFDLYLKTQDNNNHNTATKHITNLKKVIRIARANEWMKNNPFAHYKASYYKTNRSYLTAAELNTIKEKEIKIERIEKIRDIYVFACYTGLSYSDLKKLHESDIKIDIHGKKWIIVYREKTNERSPIPLLDEANEILEKYKGSPERVIKGLLLPVSSNQKMNAYLKEIADICGIEKNLTMHTARHTFATTITLTNGVPIETVSKMLGHSSIKTTEIYAKVNDTKIAKEMEALNDLLSESNAIKKASSY